MHGTTLSVHHLHKMNSSMHIQLCIYNCAYTIVHMQLCIQCPGGRDNLHVHSHDRSALKGNPFAASI